MCFLLCGCADFTVVAATPAPSAGVFVPPPTGFNHRFGNTPLSAKDGFALERALYAQNVFWEVALRIDPQQYGYPKLSDAVAVRAARHHVTSLELVVATEVGHTIVGLLAEPGNAGQERWAIAVLGRLEDLGYDNLHSAQILIYFTEADEHARLQWTAAGGYTFSIYDNNLRGTQLRPAPGTTPLPSPAAL